MGSSSTVPSASEEVIDLFLANVDVWQAIFELLPVKDRIRLEMTNKRLHILMFEHWKQVTLFDVKCLTEISCNPSINKNRWSVFVSICVNRIGDKLRSLTIREKVFPMGCWTHNLPSIGEGCPNIETINFVFNLGYRTLDIHFDSFSRLKTLTVSTPCGYSTRASASVFLSIPVSIEVIRGLEGKSEAAFENAAQMEGFFADRPSLREVDLSDLCTRDKSEADIFRVIAQRCLHLRSIKLFYNNCIDYSGVVALDSMKELHIPHALLSEMEMVTICKRSPLVEALEFRWHFSSNINLQSAALNALGSLTKLSDLRLNSRSAGAQVVAPSLVTEFVRELARNSGASLRRLGLLTDYPRGGMPLPTAAIEALAHGCGRLRHLELHVRVGKAEPASIRFLIDCIVAHPSWIYQTGERTLAINIYVMRDGGHEAQAGRAAFEALAAPAANLPDGVQLNMR